MGINLTWVCHTHKRYWTSLRGDEGKDFQTMIRMSGCPADCLRHGGLTVYHDGYFDHRGYQEWKGIEVYGLDAGSN